MAGGGSSVADRCFTVSSRLPPSSSPLPYINPGMLLSSHLRRVSGPLATELDGVSLLSGESDICGAGVEGGGMTSRLVDRGEAWTFASSGWLKGDP